MVTSVIVITKIYCSKLLSVVYEITSFVLSVLGPCRDRPTFKKQVHVTYRLSQFSSIGNRVISTRSRLMRTRFGQNCEITRQLPEK